MNEVKFRELIRRLVNEALEEDPQDDINSIEVGDVVEVEMNEIGTLPVRVIELVDDVRKAIGMPDNERPGFKGPGFVGEIDPDSGESGSLVFSLQQVIPGSKAKGYFPKDDDWGRPDPTGGRRQVHATYHARAYDYGSEWADPDEKEYNRIMGEADKPEARRADHADPSGRNWDSGLDEMDDEHADPTGRNWDSGLDEADQPVRVVLVPISGKLKLEDDLFVNREDLKLLSCDPSFDAPAGSIVMDEDGDAWLVMPTGEEKRVIVR